MTCRSRTCVGDHGAILMITVSDNIRSINPYVPGKPIEELERELGISGSIKLASNESPLGPSPKALTAVKKVMEGLNRYPDGSGFYLSQALAKHLGVDIGQVILGNGSNELIELAVRTFVSPGDEVVSADPSFVVYKMITQAANGTNVIVPCKDMRHDLDAMADAITPRTKLVFIANPNNPTGTMNTKTEMDRFLSRVPGHVLVCVDEAYFEYVTRADYPDTLDALREGRNVLALRTFSKIYGLAGLRIGYALTRADIAAHLERVRSPFNTSSVAQAAAIAALDDHEWVASSHRANLEGLRYLAGELKALRLPFTPSVANFILVHPPQDVRRLYESLLRQGVILRPMGAFGFPRSLRISVGTSSENRKAVDALRASISELGPVRP